MWTSGGLFVLILSCLLIQAAQAQQYVYNYPMIDNGTWNCTGVPVIANQQQSDLLLAGMAYMLAIGPAAFGINSTCIDVALTDVGFACPIDIHIIDGCCSAYCAATWQAYWDKPEFNPCAHVVLIRTCAYITANKGKQGVPWEALAALYNVMVNIRRRCFDGLTFNCPAIPADLFSANNTISTAPPGQPVNTPKPSPAPSPLPTTPSPSPNPTSLTPTPSPSPSPSPSQTQSSQSQTNTAAVVGGVVGGLGALAIACLLLWAFVYKGRKRKQAESKDGAPAQKDEAKTDASSAGQTDEERGQPSDPPRRSLSPSPAIGDAYAEVEVTQSKAKTTQLPTAPSEPSSDPHITVSLAAAAYEATDMQVLPGNTTVSMPSARTNTRTATDVSSSTGSTARAQGPVIAIAGTRGEVQSMSLASPGAQSVLSLDEELVYQRGALNRLQIPWNTLKLGHQLGVGGFGTVFKGQWQGNYVAVKLLKTEGISATVRMELRREALAMFEKPHPCVATLYGLVDEPNHCALVMRYYRNGSVCEVIRSGKYASVPQRNRLLYVLQVATGICCLHQRKMLHGDLKTANLLMGDDYRSVVITDFGLSDMQGASVASGALTVHISPPEVLLNPRAPRSEATDVYAFGIVMLELLLGRHCYKGMNRADIVRTVVSGERPPIPPEVPANLAEIIQACWVPKNQDRPSSAEVLARLEPAIEAAIASLSEAGADKAPQAPQGSQSEATTDWTPGKWAGVTSLPGLPLPPAEDATGTHTHGEK